MNSKPVKTNANSKVAPKKNGQKCQHVFKQGKKKGKRCNKSCRGSRCCDHSPKKAEYKQQKFAEKQKEHTEDKLTLILDKITKSNTITQSDAVVAELKTAKMRDRACLVRSKFRGYCIFLDLPKAVENLEAWKDKVRKQCIDDGGFTTVINERKYYKIFHGTKQQAEKGIESAKRVYQKLIEKYKILKQISDATRKRAEELEYNKVDLEFEEDLDKYLDD